MRFIDLVGLAFSALRQQKVRTVLTLLGVVIGTFVLLLSLSVGQGVRETIVREFHRDDQLRRIRVFRNWRVEVEDIAPDELVVQGEMSPARRERLRQAIARRWRGETKNAPQKLLTPERLKDLAAFDHIESVIPHIYWSGQIRFRNKTNQTTPTMSAPTDERPYRQRLVAGSFFTAKQPRGVVATEYLLYRLGVVNEADVESAIGGDLVLDYSSPRQGLDWNVALLLGISPTMVGADEEKVLAKIARQFPAALDRFELTAEEKAMLQKRVGRLQRPRTRSAMTIRETFRLVGVVRDLTTEERRDAPWRLALVGESDVLVPASTMQELYFRVPGFHEMGVNEATILVDNEDNVEAVEERIRGLGFRTVSLASVLKELRLNVLLVSFSTTFVALVALVVAGLGITNTLLMSVLERTHEIGVMKAVGARDRHIQALFLLEGAWIGLLGSALGLLCGRLASIPGDRIARRLAEQQTQTHLDHSLFVFPWWLVFGVPLFVTLLTMLAAAYPARRAARVNPMTALRYE